MISAGLNWTSADRSTGRAKWVIIKTPLDPTRYLTPVLHDVMPLALCAKLIRKERHDDLLSSTDRLSWVELESIGQSRMFLIRIFLAASKNMLCTLHPTVLMKSTIALDKDKVNGAVDFECYHRFSVDETRELRFIEVTSPVEQIPRTFRPSVRSIDGHFGRNRSSICSVHTRVLDQ